MTRAEKRPTAKARIGPWSAALETDTFTTGPTMMRIGQVSLSVLIGQVSLSVLIGQVSLPELIGQVSLSVLIGQVSLSV